MKIVLINAALRKAVMNRRTLSASRPNMIGNRRGSVWSARALAPLSAAALSPFARLRKPLQTFASLPPGGRGRVLCHLKTTKGHLRHENIDSDCAVRRLGTAAGSLAPPCPQWFCGERFKSQISQIKEN